MTKTSVFGENPNQTEKAKKPIEFLKVLNREGKLTNPLTAPCEWRNIQLLERKCKTFGLDLMMAWDTVDGEKYIVLGHWNDGVV